MAFNEYFIDVMGHHYTLIGVLTYALIFVAAIFLVYKYILKKIKFKIGLTFMLSLMPFIIFGGITRALKDAGFYQGFFFMSPGIYFTLFFITLASLLFSIALEKRLGVPYWKTMIIIGAILVIFDIAVVLLFYEIVNLNAMLILLGFFGMFGIVFFIIRYKFPSLLSAENAIVLFSHSIDASQNFVATYFFGYVSQMPMNSYAESVFGSWIIFPIKLGIVALSLFIIDKYSDNTDLNYWIKIAI